MKRMDDSVSLNRRYVLQTAAAIAGYTTLGAFSLASADDKAPVATTAYGRIRGVAANGVLSFRGVPYGGPAEGAGRFLPPAMPSPWQGVRDAITAGPRAMQSSSGSFGSRSIFAAPLIGEYFAGGRKDAVQIANEMDSENCLVLNVMTPALQGKRPVMVYIHGGGFAIGSGALTLLGDRFVTEEDIVLVSVNHRLNVFGYSYLGELDSKYADSGNAGQLDLVAALRWIRDNVASFGGDPANVTIFGESGGGGKVSTLLAMPTAKGLFHRAIIESGSMLSVRTKDAASADTRALLAKLNLAPTQLERLVALPAKDLLAAASASTPGAGGGLRPVVDGRSVPHQTWRPAAPPEATGVSMIIGNCKDESTLFAMSDPALFSLDWAQLKQREVKAGISALDADRIIAKYRESYSNDTPSDLYFRIASDRGARRNAIAQAQAKVAQNAGEVYMYNFAWNTPLDNGRLRACHTAELPLAMRLVLNPEAEQLSRQIAGAWAAFARTGSPNHADLPRWDAYTKTNGATMIFDAGKTAAVRHPAREELALLAPYSAALL